MRKNNLPKRKVIVMRCILPLIFVNATTLLYAQADSTLAKQLDEVSITAQRVRQKELNIPYAVKKLAQFHLAQFVPRTTPEALQGMAGIFVQKTNHGGGSPFIRGLTGNQALLLMDGIRLNNATYRYGPNQYLNTIDPFIIESIEVAKGTGSVQYGTDALGGVIQLLSYDPEFATGKNRLVGKAFVKYMSAGMEKTARGNLNYSTRRMAFTAGTTVRDFGDLVGGDTTGKQFPSGYSEWAFNAKAKILLRNHLKLTLSHQLLRQKHVPLYHKVRLENFAVSEFDLQQHQLQYAKLEWAPNKTWAEALTLTVSRQKTGEGRTSKKNNSNTLRNESDKVNTLGLTLQLNSKLSEYWSANTGIEMYKDKVNSQTTDTDETTGVAVQKRGLYPNHATYDNYSLYSLHHFKFNRWYTDAGVRLNTFSIKLLDSALGNVHITPSALVYNAAVSYVLTSHQRLYLSYSSGYRAPNIDDMGTLGIVDFRYEVPSANLDPEKSGNLEAGFKFKNKRLAGDIAFYYMKLNDLITRVKEEGEMINGYPVYRKENTEAAFIKGTEASLAWLPLKGLQLNGNITCLYGHNKTKNEPMRRMPPLHGSMKATYKTRRCFSAVEWMYAGKQSRLAQGDKDDNRIPLGGTPGWNVLNIYAGVTGKYYQLNTGLQNIFNTDYRTHGSGINGVGRSVWVSLGVNF